MHTSMTYPSTKKLSLNLEFPMGSTVYLSMRQERMPGMVTGILLCPTGLLYQVAWGDASETRHYEMELTAEFTPNFEVDA